MHKFALIAFPLIAMATPVAAADLDGYGYGEPAVAPPPVVERERIIERRYYPAPAYAPPPVYVAPRVYYDEPAYYVRPYRYAYGSGYPVGYYPRRFYGGGYYGPRRHW